MFMVIVVKEHWWLSVGPKDNIRTRDDQTLPGPIVATEGSVLNNA
jgi:hypothetical protein